MRAQAGEARNERVQAHGDQHYAQAVAVDPQVTVRCPDIPVETLLGGR